MSPLVLIIIVVVILLLVGGSHPRWGYHAYGYRPMGLFAFCLIIVLILWAVGRI